MKLQSVTTQHRQRGVAAVEFALVATAMLLYGTTVFGMALYTQQALEHAVADGARAALMINEDLESNDERVRRVVYDSLLSTRIALPPVSDPDWFSLARTGRLITVSVTYPYALLAVVPAPAQTPWFPLELRSAATASGAMRSSSCSTSSVCWPRWGGGRRTGMRWPSMA